MTAGAPDVHLVAVGGGHGLANTLRAARRFATNITAVVSVADDGGSSGRLREALGTIAPGDLRKCLVALGDDGVWSRAFEHRFQGGELAGHALGNLLITGLIEATGDVVAALDAAGALVSSAGRVLPATVDPVVLHADSANGPVDGQVAVSGTERIGRLSVVPADAEVPEAAIKAIAEADLVVMGPGSLYTSVLAAAAVPAIRDAIAATAGMRVYVCNLRPQAPETAGYRVADHVAALVAHGLQPDVVLCDPAQLPVGACLAAAVVERSLAGPNALAHDPERLALALADLIG